MGVRTFALFALSGTQLFGALAAAVEKRQDVTHKYCPGGTNICFSETQANDITFRIAIPDVQSAPFDILLQVVAPISTAGWAGIGWGGKMANNPLTVGWANGNGVVVSSRWTTGHTQPQPYTGATYTVLPSAHTNATHWHLDVLCTGCSQWGTTSLNPNGVNTLAWAKSSKSVQTAASNSSVFGYHDGRGTFGHDFSTAKIPQGVFDALVYDIGNPSTASTTSKVQSHAEPPSSAGGSSAANPPSSAQSSVVTRVTTLSQPQQPTPSTPVVQTSVVTLPHTTPPTRSGGEDSPVTRTTIITKQPSPSPTPSAVTIWITEPDDGEPVAFTQPPGAGSGGVVTVTVTSVLAPGAVTPGPLGPWGNGPPPWASSGALPPWGTSGPPPWATAGVPPIVIPPIIGKGKGKGKGPPGRPVAAENPEQGA
ncbi:CBD9-like protein [Thozetella sp. PMI_491]|nr:CBD9-like protein [Thozetella sp. PMI_491]